MSACPVAVAHWRPLLQDLLAVTPAHKAAAFRGLMEGAVALERGDASGARLMLRHAKDLRHFDVAREAAQKLVDEIEQLAELKT